MDEKLVENAEARVQALLEVTKFFVILVQSSPTLFSP